MIRKLILIIIPILFFVGCVSGPIPRHVEEILYEQGKLQRYSYYDESYGEKNESSAFMEAIDIIKQADPTAIPEMDELVLGHTRTKSQRKRAYTGVIRNMTKHELSVPSQNSQATLLIPPQGYVEFTAWDPIVKFSPYLDGKPYRCFNIRVKPKAYEFMCKNYDFMAVIEPTEKPEKPEYYKKYKKRYRKPGTG
jgi:hypothetical protein